MMNATTWTRNLPSMITAMGMTISRESFLVLEEAFRMWKADLVIELSYMDAHNLCNLGLLRPGYSKVTRRSTWELTDRAFQSFHLATREGTSYGIEPRDAFDAFLRPRACDWIDANHTDACLPYQEIPVELEEGQG